MQHDFEITEEMKLPKEFKTDWVNALMSGDYKQGTGVLHLGGFYCCLGVACKMQGYTDEDMQNAGTITKGFDESHLNRDFRKIPKAIKGKGGFNKVVGHLTISNDEGSNFEEIATWIEDNL